MIRAMADPSVARRIRLRRQALRLSQQQLADELGVTRATVSRWELGLHAPDKHEGAIEAALGIDLTSDPPEEDPGEQELREMRHVSPSAKEMLREFYRTQVMKQPA